tara:strand:- start:2774 stop:3619 length:846 start_codon:yes stop_codon:yes gene_type:complete
MIEKGYLIYANNNSKCNYVRQAYALSLSIKYFNKDAHVTVVTENTLCERLRAGFDDVIVPNKAPISQSVLNSEQRIHAYNISPYLKTIVMDADVLVTQNLDSWWNYLEKYMIYYVSDARTYRDEKSDSISYRKTFVENQLPNLYNAFHYFEKSDEASRFFRLQQMIVENWQKFYSKYTPKKKQKWCSMDVSAAIASKILDNYENITDKDSFVNVVHLKPQQQGWNHDYVNSSGAVTLHFSNDNFYIGNFKQHGIIHYVEDHFLTEEIIRKLEKVHETISTV